MRKKRINRNEIIFERWKIEKFKDEKISYTQGKSMKLNIED